MSNLEPTENLVRNIKLFMIWRSLNHPTVAKRMRILGFPWHPKTVYRILDGERPVHVDEEYGLALVFETTVATLLDPATAEPQTSEGGFESGFQIGLMKPLGLVQFRKLLDVPEDRLEHAEIGVRSWSSRDFVDGVPQWKTWPLASANQKINAMLTVNGWSNVDEVLAAHPEGFDVLMDLVRFIAEHPRPQEEAPVN